MNEWVVTGNRPTEFVGELTDRQQYMWDVSVAEWNLQRFMPEDCRTCLPVRLHILGDLAYQLVKGEISKEAAIQKTIEQTSACPGPQVERGWADKPALCPVEDARREGTIRRC